MSFNGASTDEKKHVENVNALNDADLLCESDYTEDQYRAIRRKIDRYLLPLMWVAYGVQQADKTGLSTQALFGIREDTHLVGQQFSW
ncbi:hypothetical protein PM082_008235 [Marasmius tenuissimus]|nr:hypothetical protein PM082_008235 [Marasmius tenuissimus]